MAMRPKLWSINAIAAELGMDRRTVTARLRGVAPKGKIAGGHDGWLFADALAACNGERSGPTPAEREAAITTLSILGYRVMCLMGPAEAAKLMVLQGIPLPTAFVFSHIFAERLLELAEGCLPGSVAGLVFDRNRDGAADADDDDAEDDAGDDDETGDPSPSLWESLATYSGETIDRAAWEAELAAERVRLGAAG